MARYPCSRFAIGAVVALALTACGGSDATRLVTDDLGVVPLDGGVPAGDAGSADAAPPEPACDKGVHELGFTLRGQSAARALPEIAGYTEVRSLHISATRGLESLEGLECLRTVRCTLAIGNNRDLRSLKGLENLARVGRIASGGDNAFPPEEFDALVARVEQRWDAELCEPRIAPGPGSELGGLLELGGRGELDTGPREPPAEVAQEGAYVGETFDDFDELAGEGPATDPRGLLRVVPRDYREELRERWVEYDDETEQERLPQTVPTSGVWLDAEHTRFLARWSEWAVGSLVALLDADGRLLDKAFFEQRLGILLKDVVGSGTKELVLEVVEGNALSSWPMSWWIYEVAGRKLKRIARFAKQYSSGSKYEEYYFVNKVTFPARGEMQVECVYFAGLDAFADLAPPRGYPRFAGERHEFEYRKGKYVKTFSSSPPRMVDKKHGAPEGDDFGGF